MEFAMGICVVATTWILWRVWSAIKCLTVIASPILGVPVMPTDFLVESDGDSDGGFWSQVKKALGLPVRWLGFGYAFGYQQVNNSSLTGSDILLAAHELYGPVFQYQALGNHVVSIGDPRAAKRVLANFDKDMRAQSLKTSPAARMWNLFSANLPRTLVSMTSGEAHRQKRSLFKACFHENHIQTQHKIIEALLVKFGQTFGALADSGETVYLTEKFSSLAVEVICETAMQFDLSKDSQGASYLDCYNAMAKDLEILIKSFWLINVPPLLYLTIKLPVWLLPVKYLRDVKQARARIDVIMEKLYQNIMKMPPDSVIPNSFVEAIRTYDAWPETNKAQVKHELLLFFFAGHETTGNTLSWFFYHMVSLPDVQSQCQGAIDEQLANAAITGKSPSPARFDAVPSMSQIGSDQDEILPAFVESCLKESMRLFPVVPGSTRKVNKSTTLTIEGREGAEADTDDGFAEVDGSLVDGESKEGDEQKSKGCTIVLPASTFTNINFYALHRNPQSWGKDAAFFDEARFLHDERLSSPAIFEGGGRTSDELIFAPFSHGHRGCIGKHLALLEIRLCIKELLTRYNFQLADPAYEKQGGNLKVEALTVRPKERLPVIVTKRSFTAIRA